MIRDANKFDMPELIAMMRDYSAQAPATALQTPRVHDQSHVEQMMASMMAGRGFVIIDDQSRGFIAAIVIGNVWCPTVIELHELAWWVKPEHRNGTVGGRLWKEFDLRAQRMLADGKIDIACTSVLANSQFIDYTKRGYQPMEATFFREQ